MYVFLTETTYGSSFSNYGNSKIHTVELTDLEPNTRYYYRVVVGDYESYSDLHDFITPPEPSSEASFRIIAISDMQRDNSNPNKFDEVIHDGVIDYLSDEYSDDLASELAMVLVTGDLVVTGSSYYQWQDHFFGPSEDLFSHVPLYPVFGNHEANADYFIKYFHLPDYGTPGYEEHWWFKDISNVLAKRVQKGFSTEGVEFARGQVKFKMEGMSESQAKVYGKKIFNDLPTAEINSLFLPLTIIFIIGLISFLSKSDLLINLAKLPIIISSFFRYSS